MNGRLDRNRTPALIGLLICLLAACGCSPDRRITGFEEFRAEVLKPGLYPGGPVDRFEKVGRMTLVTSIEHGLMPDHRVLDVGAGALRVAWWLVHYIDPSNYHAIEPKKKRIDAAAAILGADINIYYNDDFEFPDEKFDFVIARSIWTHASKAMISKMLAEFAENSSPDARFLASVRFAESEQDDYMGDEWVSRGVRPDGSTFAVINHSRDWIRKECEKHGLSLQVLDDLYAQTWVLARRKHSLR